MKVLHFLSKLKVLGEQQHFQLFLLWASCNTKKLSIASCHKQIIQHDRARWKLKWNFNCSLCLHGTFSVELPKSTVACANSFSSAETEAGLSACLQSVSLETQGFHIT